MKPLRSFWFHYNKPASAKAGAPRLTIHWKGQCHIVESLDIKVPTSSRIRQTQPRVVIAGKCKEINFKGGHATVW